MANRSRKYLVTGLVRHALDDITYQMTSKIISTHGGRFKPLVDRACPYCGASKLTRREFYVMTKRLGGSRPHHSPHTFTSIGRELGLSLERVRQILSRAIRKIENGLVN